MAEDDSLGGGDSLIGLINAQSFRCSLDLFGSAKTDGLFSVYGTIPAQLLEPSTVCAGCSHRAFGLPVGRQEGTDP